VSKLDLALVPIQQYTKFEVSNLNISQVIVHKLKLGQIGQGHQYTNLTCALALALWGNEAT
jgi:hypothetical protein